MSELDVTMLAPLRTRMGHSDMSMMRAVWRRFLFMYLLLVVGSSNSVAQFAPLDLGAVGGVTQSPVISSDGTVVVGAFINQSGFLEASFFTNGVVTGLGFLGSIQPSSFATATSSDGAVIVGASSNSAGRTEAFRWNAGQITGLGFLSASPQSYSIATGTSSDGSVIVGSSTNSSGVFEAFRWVNGAMVGLGSLAPTSTELASWASGVSSDGTVVVGRSASSSGVIEAFRWQGGTITGLGSLAPGRPSSALAVSGDGGVIVGWSRNASDLFEAFRWEAGAMMGLGFLDNAVSDRFSQANAVSQDGKVIVGIATTSSGIDGAFRWTQANGLQLLDDAAQSAGVNLGGYVLLNATGVSAKGDTIVGQGIDPDGQGTTWILRIDEQGLTTANSLTQSLSSVAALTAGLSSWLDGGAATLGEVARQGGCDRAIEFSRPLCGFSFVEAGTFLSDDVEGLGGTFGLKTTVGDDWTAGVALRGAALDGDLGFDGYGDLDVYGGGVFFGTHPHNGLQLTVTAQTAAFDGTIHRNYINGANIDASSGDMSAVGFTGGVRVAWSTHVIGGLYLLPFADYSVTRLKLDGWAENSGPFPAVISDLESTQHKLRLGTDLRLVFYSGAWIWGGIAWAEHLGSKPLFISAEFEDLFEISSQVPLIEKRWLEATSGVTVPVGTAGTLTASTSLYFSNDLPLAQARMGYIHNF